MINPSTNGWIEKFFQDCEGHFLNYGNDYHTFYEKTRESGFIYGYCTSIPLKEQLSLEGNSHDEIIKIGLLNALYSVYSIVKQSNDVENFISLANAFYKTIQHENYNFLNKLLPTGSDNSKLEAIINNRVQTNANFVSKNFSHIITNALLFIDVLAFHHYLVYGKITSKYIKEIELCTINLIMLAFNVKINKSKYDELLVKLFENSLRFTKIDTIQNPNLDNLKLKNYSFEIEKLYLLDLTEMALWSDEKLDHNELSYLKEIAVKLNLPSYDVTKSCQNIDNFIRLYKDEIPYFNYSNPVKHFYDQTNKTVTKLIRRNRKRLTKEISESRELMVLLAQSTSRELDEEEKKKVKKQLLDICKTIPSLTIFLLPGGGILLPILIKYIPQLLPSAFNENLED